MRQKELKKRILKIEEELESLIKQKEFLENEGCFSDKEIKEKREKLNEFNGKIKKLLQDKEDIKQKLRLGNY